MNDIDKYLGRRFNIGSKVFFMKKITSMPNKEMGGKYGSVVVMEGVDESVIGKPSMLYYTFKEFDRAVSNEDVGLIF